MHRVYVNASWKLRSGGETGEAVAASRNESAEYAEGVLGDPSMEDVPGSQPRGVGAPREDGFLVCHRLLAFGRGAGGA